MRNILIFISFSFGLLPLASPLASAVDNGSDISPVVVAVSPMTPEEVALVQTVFADFASAGLDFDSTDLPEIGFSDDLDVCEGQYGVYRPNQTPQVRVCWTHENPSIELGLRRQALTHELAHAWTDRYVDRDAEAAYLAVADLDTWGSRERPWERRGIEHAAELITWGVLDPSVRFIEFDDARCARWAGAFELLTGQAAPAPLTAC